MLNLLVDFVTIGIVCAESLERKKNTVSYIAAKTRYKYLQEYDKETPYDIKYSKAIVFLIMVLIWPLTIPIFFKDAENPEKDFSDQ